MTTILQQFLDVIIVTTDDGTYYAVLPEFEQDYGESLPPLPEGITSRAYEPGKYHALKRENDVVDGGSVPWPEGDAVLARNAELVAIQEERVEAGKIAPNLSFDFIEPPS